MEQTKLRVVIAGGGIGGLCAAVGLQQRGHEVIVLERAPELRPVGAGLTVQINAMRAFAKLGLAEQVAAAGQVIRRAAIRDAAGATLSQMAMDVLAEELGAPCIGIHRAALQGVLLAALHPSTVRVGTTVTGFTQEADGISVALSGGATLRGDVLIGADGIHSAIRAQLHGAAEPTYAGYTAWRGVCENTGIQDPEMTSETWGAGMRFGLVPVGPGTLYWFGVADAEPHGRDGADVKERLLASFAGWHREVGEAIRATPVERILRSDISDRPVLSSWGEGRVTLLGDAAHPMTPNLGQGACMAIEDAVVLQSALAEKADPAAALRLYESRRMERTAATVNLARKFGRMGQWSNGVARAVRDAMVQATPAFIAERQMRWLYDFVP